MKKSFKTVFSFGLTSGVITTLGLIVGLHSGIGSKIAVIGGILTIALADAFSDALGIHVSQESQSKYSVREIWESTIATFIAKFIFALSFMVPLLLFNLNLAVIISIIWGMLILTVFSYLMVKENKVKVKEVVLEHLAIALLVVLATHYLGDLIANLLPE